LIVHKDSEVVAHKLSLEQTAIFLPQSRLLPGRWVQFVPDYSGMF
jgi:hypothetical protein